jgi:hypothetical protein
VQSIIINQLDPKKISRAKRTFQGLENHQNQMCASEKIKEIRENIPQGPKKYENYLVTMENYM